MKKTFKTFLIAIILLMVSFSYVQALDLFLANNNQVNNETEVEISEENITDIENETYENNTTIEENVESSIQTNPAPTVTTTVSSDNTLTISDIIDIILISVCIVLIFLAIAILIRCK